MPADLDLRPGLPLVVSRPRLGTILSVLVLVISTSVGAWSMNAALDRRETAAAARDLQVSAMRVAAADAVYLAGGELRSPGLDASVEALGGDHSAALVALPAADALTTETLLREIAGCGAWLLDPNGEAHKVHDHAELQTLLDVAALTAAAEASSAEAIAATALLGALLAVASCLWLFGRARRRTERQLLEARAEERAGRRLQDDLRRQAGTDVLTDLPNRRRLPLLLDEARRLMASSTSTTGLVMLDIDAFKGVNDSFGHEAGDRLLQLVAKRLTRVLGSHGEVLRFGSDEFAVFFHLQTEAEAADQAKNLQAVFNQSFEIGGRAEHLSCSVGFAVVDDPAEIDQLHSRAELALLGAKRSESNAVVGYESSLEESVAAVSRIRRALQSAVYDDEFSLVYQPIVAADTGEIVSLEALLRWNSPELGLVGPDQFIPLAETNGDICPIGKWVVESVCRQVSLWAGLGISQELTVSFNVSARQLAEPDFVTCVSTTAAAWGIDPARLVVEVTETAALDGSGVAIGRLKELGDAGFLISIDDFGSGYSNLGQLLRVPFNVLKIDRSLLLMLTEMREEAGGDATGPCDILSAIVSIAEILGVSVVCEGVETVEQRRSVTASGVTHIQGYLTGRPASVSATTEMLDHGRSVAPNSSGSMIGANG